MHTSPEKGVGKCGAVKEEDLLCNDISPSDYGGNCSLLDG